MLAFGPFHGAVTCRSYGCHPRLADEDTGAENMKYKVIQRGASCRGLEPASDALSCSPPPGPAAFPALRDPYDSQVFGLRKFQSSESLSLSHWFTAGAQEARLRFYFLEFY